MLNTNALSVWVKLSCEMLCDRMAEVTRYYFAFSKKKWEAGLIHDREFFLCPHTVHSALTAKHSDEEEQDNSEEIEELSSSSRLLSLTSVEGGGGDDAGGDHCADQVGSPNHL